jgi:hypothetical protein
MKVLGTWTSMCRGRWVRSVCSVEIIEESSMCRLWLVVSISLSSNVYESVMNRPWDIRRLVAFMRDVWAMVFSST